MPVICRVLILLSVGISLGLGVAGCVIWDAIGGKYAETEERIALHRGPSGDTAIVQPVVMADTAITAGKPEQRRTRLPTLREQMRAIVRSQQRIEQRLDTLAAEVRQLRSEIARMRELLESTSTMLPDTADQPATVQSEQDTIAILLPDTVIQHSADDHLPSPPVEDSIAIVDSLQGVNANADSAVSFPEEYHEALRLFVQKKYRAARQAFERLLQRNDLHSVVRTYIYYWLGEIAFAQQRYNEAITEFQRVIQSKLIPKMDDALFLSAEAALRLKDIRRAKHFYRQLITKFPASPFAPRARAMLQIL